MNEKLKQSLDTRLGGMRWGERDQAEVFRLAQRKELQDVKHVKRGTGMLAIAVALLFIVMGAAFALTTANDQPAASNVAGQTTQPTFIPVISNQYENDYFTLDVNTTTCTDAGGSFTATIRMKDPARYMLSLAGHTPPGDVSRVILPVTLRAGIMTMLPGDVPMACGQFSDVDVTDMTADTAVFRMSGSVGSLYEDVTFTLYITWTDPADGVEHHDEVTWRIDTPAQQGMLLQKFDLVTVTLAEYTTAITPDGVTGHLTLDVTPGKSWYVLNRQEEGKSTLTVSAETLLLYPAFDPQETLRMVEYREPAAGEFPVTLEVTSDGLRLTAEGTLPEGGTLYGYLVLHVYSATAEAHYDEGFDDHYYEVCIPIVTTPTGVATVTAKPTPMHAEAISTPTPQPAANRLWIFENELIVGYSAGTVMEGGHLRVTIDVVPKNAEHVINAAVPGKTSLYVSPAWYGGYDGSTPLQALSVADGAFVNTEEGARLSALLPFPEGHQSLTFALDVTTIGNGAQHTNHFVSTLYRPGAYPTPPAMRTARPEPTGDLIGGTDTVSVYLEESWSDGFTTEATLRIRADDPADRLAALPNQNGLPDGSTWVVQLTGPDEYYPCHVQIHTDDATGDLLAEVTFLDLSDIYQDGMLDLTLTTTNELTWESYSEPLRPVIPVSADYEAHQLHLVSSTVDGMYVQGSTLTSDRYHYIGVMLDYSVGYNVTANLTLDGNPEVISSGAYGTSGATLISFPKRLFPYEGSDGTKYILLVLRVEKTVVLPDPLPIHLTSGTPAKGYTTLAELQLSPNRALQQMDSNVIFDTPLLTATLVQTDFVDGHAAGQMQIRLKDPISYTLDPNDPAEGKVYVKLTAALCAYNGDERPEDYLGDCIILTDVQPDSCMVTFYGYFPDWNSADSADPWCISLIDARAEDGRFREHYDARFRFPRAGSITRWNVKPAGNIQAEGFDFDSGLLVQTDYLNVLTINWTGEAKLGANLYKGNGTVRFLPYTTFIRGEVVESEQQTHSYFLEEFDESATYSVLIYPSAGQTREMRPLLFFIPYAE